MLDQDQRALRKFYTTLRNRDRIDAKALYSSNVYYARWLIFEKKGEIYPLEHVQIAAWLEGMIPADEVTEIPEWYVEKYMNGVKPDMAKLRAKVEQMYKAKRPAPVSAEPVVGCDKGVPWKT